MISNQVLQNTLEGLKEISRTEFCIIDTEGKVLATTFADFSIQPGDIQAFVESQADSQLVKGFQYFKVCDDYQLEYILVAHGDDEDTYMVGKLAAFQIQNLIVAYKERFDKDSFIKNLLLDNLLLVDIYNRAKKLHIEADVRRVVMILELNQEKDHSSVESVKSLFGGKSRDFITAVDEKSIIIVKELEEGEGYPEMDKLAHTIMDTLDLNKDGEDVHMAYGTIVNELKEVSRSYKEARMALDVGKIFFGDREVIAYSSLGIGRLIYRLPTSLCENFLHEIFGEEIPQALDEETTANIGIIQGGRATNVVAGETVLYGEARSLNKEKVDGQIAHMIACCEEAAQEMGGTAVCKVEECYAAIDLDPESVTVQLACAAVRRLGMEPHLVKSGGGSDANVFCGKGIPATNVGVGMTNVHSVDRKSVV